ncbi:MAG: hypothetical protein V4719_08855 [Planctomycetota bacterium]
MDRKLTRGRRVGWGLLLFVFWFLGMGGDLAAETVLSPHLGGVPFPYLVGGVREWPILERAWPSGTRSELTAREGDKVLGTGETLDIRGVSIAVTPQGRLRITAQKAAALGTFQLIVTLHKPGEPDESQTLEIRPAPPDRPISYYADFVDDLIRMFANSTGQLRPITKTAFDQYFRRLQAHGTKRLIVWLSPFPYIADRANYAPEDWQRYEGQARAIMGDNTLTAGIGAQTELKSWAWLRYLMATRLDSQFGELLGQSAADHGISLTVSYRPFEAALTKYYEVPTFDSDGTYLWGFLPLASPTINYRPEQVGWRHYRDALHEIGKGDAAELVTIELPGVTNPEQFAGKPGLQICVAPLPPVADNSLVLVRAPSGEYQLRPYADVREVVERKFQRIEVSHVEAGKEGLLLTQLPIPRESRYLILSWTGEGDGPDIAALAPVILRAKAGNRLGRETTYWVFGGSNDESRTAAIMADGDFRAEFQASQFSQRTVAQGPERLTLKGRQLVIDLGDTSSVEMIDFNQPLARQNAVREIATILKQPGFDDILINTRSHVDQPLSIAVGDHGTKPAGQYWSNRWSAKIHLGLDKAYLPRSDTSLTLLRDLAQQPEGIERITTWQPDEWGGECQTPEGPPWRYARNRGTADGMRLLLTDLEQAFPGRRIRVLIPPGEAAVRRIWDGLDALDQPTGAKYGRGFYYQLWCSNNHNPAVGEGMALVDLRGLSAEPALLGSGGYLPGLAPVSLYVRECLADLMENRGSKFRGPRSYFFEAQFTLRATDLAAARRAREEMMCHFLAQRGEIGEVILYEAADWLYFMSLSDEDLCSHRFLDRCEAKKVGAQLGAD